MAVEAVAGGQHEGPERPPHACVARFAVAVAADEPSPRCSPRTSSEVGKEAAAGRYEWAQQLRLQMLLALPVIEAMVHARPFRISFATGTCCGTSE